MVWCPPLPPVLKPAAPRRAPPAPRRRPLLQLRPSAAARPSLPRRLRGAPGAAGRVATPTTSRPRHWTAPSTPSTPGAPPPAAPRGPLRGAPTAGSTRTDARASRSRPFRRGRRAGASRCGAPRRGPPSGRLPPPPARRPGAPTTPSGAPAPAGRSPPRPRCSPGSPAAAPRRCWGQASEEAAPRRRRGGTPQAPRAQRTARGRPPQRPRPASAPAPCAASIWRARPPATARCRRPKTLCLRDTHGRLCDEGSVCAAASARACGRAGGPTCRCHVFCPLCCGAGPSGPLCSHSDGAPTDCALPSRRGTQSPSPQLLALHCSTLPRLRQLAEDSIALQMARTALPLRRRVPL